MAKLNHRAAFTNDPKLMARIATQLAAGNNPPASPVPSAQVVEEPPKKSVSAATKRANRVREQNMESRYDTVSFCPATGALTVVLAGAALLSLNVSLRLFDAKATSLKKTWKERIRALHYENPAVFRQWKESAKYPVIVEEVYITGESQCLDSESVTASCKPIIDSLVVAGILPDDDPRHIVHPIPYTKRGANPGIVIRLYPAPGDHGLITQAAMEAAHSIPLVSR
jgi:hypothetical protein